MQSPDLGVRATLQKLNARAAAATSLEELIPLMRALDPRLIIRHVHDSLCGAGAGDAGLPAAVRTSLSPNGFLRLYLSDAANRQVRVHVWHPDFDVEEPDVHNHRWPFVSRIVCGRLRVEEFVEASEGNEMLRFRHHALGSADGFDLIKDGVASLRQLRATLYTRGDVYITAEEKLHRVTREASLAATLLVEGRQTSATTAVYNASPADKGKRDVKQPNVEAILDVLASIEEAIMA